jgi:hypothetical protein
VRRPRSVPEPAIVSAALRCLVQVRDGIAKAWGAPAYDQYRSQSSQRFAMRASGERSSIPMRNMIRGVVALFVLVGAGGIGHAKCGDNPGDAAAVAAARQDVEDTCDCAGSTNHGQFVKCAAGVANTRAGANQLPKNCKGAVKKCAAKSTCGKPGFVTCCVTKNSTTKCKLKKSEAACTAKGGTAGTCSSCCDACPAPGTGPSCSPSGAFLDPAGF